MRAFAEKPKATHQITAAISSIPRRSCLQTKLRVSEPGDAYEKEADRVSERVMREPGLPMQGGCTCGGECPKCQAKHPHHEPERLQTDRVPASETRETAAPPIVHAALDSPGRPLDLATRTFMEPRLGHDFSSVRVHCDAAAAQGARAISARAYTVGRDIGFASGEYAPATSEGKRLIAHELVHVVQQAHAFPAVISRQKATPDGTPEKPTGAKDKRSDPKVLLQEPCFGERVDDARARCQFSTEQLNLLRIIKEHALRRCARASAAVNMPGNESEVKRIAKDYFHLDLKLTDKTRRTLIDKIKAVSEKLEQTGMECGTCQDEHCNPLGSIAYVEARVSLVLCPLFFHDEVNKVSSLPRKLIHEGAHLAGLNVRTRDEMYCHVGATKEDKCPVVDAFHNADAWSYFIEDLAFTI